MMCMQFSTNWIAIEEIKQQLALWCKSSHTVQWPRFQCSAYVCGRPGQRGKLFEWGVKEAFYSRVHKYLDRENFLATR